MESLKEVFKIGRGPSSSHTMGPERAAQKFKNMYPNAHKYRVELYGSLAATGKGHMTDYIVKKTLSPKHTDILWNALYIHPYHTNDNKKELWEYVDYCEDKDIWEYLESIYDAMYRCVKRGIQKDGLLPAKLKFQRKAKQMYEQSINAPLSLRLTKRMFSYALAASEENASGEEVVTAPTCGACGVIPGVLIAMVEEFDIDKKTAIKGLAVAGIIGSLIKKNATVSGAEGGCQAEIGSACSMASAMATFFLGGDLDQIEYAAESGMEHALGMTCDPVGGYVIVPCIERNAVFSVKALNTANYVLSVGSDHIISFDDVIITMAETGKDLCPAYRETSKGGLAKYYENLLDKQKNQKI